MATQEEIKNIFADMANQFNVDKAAGESASFQFELGGDNGGVYWLKVDDGAVSNGEGEIDADVNVKADADDFYAIATGATNPMQAFMMGKIKIDNMGMGMKLMQWFGLGS